MRALLTYLLLVATCFVRAQVKIDSVYTLPAAVKVADGNTARSNNSNAFKSYKYVEAKTLNDALRECGGVYFKNYGNGQLSSITIRGTSAAQTDLLWNGIKLNSPSLGQVDVSLFNTGMSDQLELGGISRSGNVGGYINFKSEGGVDSGLALSATVTYGSFNTIRSFGKIKYGNGKVAGITRASYLQSDNNYPFVNTYKEGSPVERLTNAKVQLLNFMQQLNVRVNNRNIVLYSFWLSDAQRKIPPIISKPAGKESQDDYSLRNSLAWKGSFGKLNVNVVSAFLHDAIQYRNPEIYLDEKSVMEAFRNNLSLSYDSLKQFTVYGELGYDFERAMVPAYGLTRSRHIAKAAAGFKYTPVPDFTLQVDIREAIYGKVLSPFSPIVSMRYFKRLAANHNLVVRANVSRNYRFPTLNDLYWVPGGNPNLKTEKSVDGEAGLQYWNSRFNAKATAFCKYVTNWIQWIPTGSYWEPRNVKRVLTRGVEVSATLNGPFRGITNKFDMSLNVNYTYTRATNLDAISPADQSAGKQLIYVPQHLANLGIYLEYRSVYVRAVNNYTGAVFITTDNTQTLKAYYQLDLEVGKTFAIREYEITAAFVINNVTGVQYQNIAQRPMPGRNFEGKLRFNFN